MPASLALILWFVLLVVLAWRDPAKDASASAPLWVPAIWMFICGSRLPSQWLAGSHLRLASGNLEEGNPLDRTIFFVLILLAIGILISRSFRWGNFFARNAALMAFLSFALLSVFWSDFPLIAFRRWYRDLGNYLMILVALSDPHPLDALRTLIRRVCYLLIPLSVTLIKYFPDIGRGYSAWTGAPNYSGATSGKDSLGALCMLSILFFFWDTATRWSRRKERRTKKIILVNLAFIGMSLWMLNLSNCATCRVCLPLGCLVVLAARTNWAQRHPIQLKWLLPLGLTLCAIAVYSFNLVDQAAQAVGRDSTFTGRTELWQDIFGMKTNPIVGTGYESFWLGPRLLYLWERNPWQPNQAHNGYLEVYINLGLIGLVLICGFLILSYGSICRKLRTAPNFASLGLALWTILVVDNLTSASLGKGDLLWMTYLLAGIPSVKVMEDRAAAVAASDNLDEVRSLPKRPLETVSQRR